MVNRSNRYNGENVSLYKIDWEENDRKPVQQRFDGIHLSPVRQEDAVYLFVKGDDYEDTAVPFDEVRERHVFHYEEIDDENITRLYAEDVGTEDLPEDLYDELLDTVNEREFNVESLTAADHDVEPIEAVNPVAEPSDSYDVVEE